MITSGRDIVDSMKRLMRASDLIRKISLLINKDYTWIINNILDKIPNENKQDGLEAVKKLLMISQDLDAQLVDGGGQGFVSSPVVENEANGKEINRIFEEFADLDKTSAERMSEPELKVFVKRIFDLEEINEDSLKKAYRRLSVNLHPDKNPDNKDAKEAFQMVGFVKELADKILKDELFFNVEKYKKELKRNIAYAKKKESALKWEGEFPELEDEGVVLAGRRDPAGKRKIHLTYTGPIEIFIENSKLLIDESSYDRDILTVRWIDLQTEEPIMNLRLLEEEKVYSIGRDSPREGIINDLDIQDGNVSRRHLTTERKGRKLIIKDIGSFHGAKLKKKEIKKTKEEAVDQEELEIKALIEQANQALLKGEIEKAEELFKKAKEKEKQLSKDMAIDNKDDPKSIGKKIDQNIDKAKQLLKEDKPEEVLPIIKEAQDLLLKHWIALTSVFSQERRRDEIKQLLLEAQKAILKMFTQGTKVSLQKIAIKEGEKSSMAVGQIMKGTLVDSIQVGKQIFLLEGSRTSKVENIEIKDKETLAIHTQTSIYEVKITSSSPLTAEIPPTSEVKDLAPGGIDLNPAALNMQLKGENTSSPTIFKNLPFDPSTTLRVNLTNFQGFTFQIIKIEPVKDLASLIRG